MSAKIRLLFMSLILILSIGCDPTDTETGSIAVRAIWPSPAEWQALTPHRLAPRSAVPAQAKTVRVRISATDMAPIKQDFPVEAHRGVISNVPAGTDRLLILQALNSAGGLLADCKKPGLLIEAGKTTQAGDCIFEVAGGAQSRAIEPEMVSITSGCFDMGSPDTEDGRDNDETLHNVCVDAFKMGKYEVTHREYIEFLNDVGRSPDRENEPWIYLQSDNSGSHIIVSDGGYQVESGYEDHPMIYVSWFGATAYAEWLSRETGKKYRLPTEAEWEYTARAGTATRYWWGDEDPVCQKGVRNSAKFDDDADCHDTGAEPVGFSSANPWGLYDVHGNAWEWTCSKYVTDYDGSELKCLSKSDAGSYRVFRGGTWGEKPRFLRSANRDMFRPAILIISGGFRLAQDL